MLIFILSNLRLMNKNMLPKKEKPIQIEDKKQSKKLAKKKLSDALRKNLLRRKAVDKAV